MARGGDQPSWFSRAGWALTFAGLIAGYTARSQIRTGAASMARITADTLESSTDLVERSVRGATRVALLPADATLELARDRVLSGLPEAADTKWRVLTLLIRATVSSAVERDLPLGPDLDRAGEAYARATLPEGNWDPIVLRETLRRSTRAIDLTGTERRDGNTIEVITTVCPLIEAVAPERRPGVCEAICGESESLLHGIAVAANATITSPERMGLGAPRCVRRFTLSTSAPPEATPPPEATST